MFRMSLNSPTETDEEVVREIVRTGEASRLRRRGAMRLDPHLSLSGLLRRQSVDESFAEAVRTSALNPVAGGYSLFCGVEDWTALSDDDESPPVPSPLPGYPPTRKSPSGTRPRVPRWTGCSALLHTNSAPNSKDGTWCCVGPATAAVVRLDEAYFERGGKSTKNPCGCSYEGVGCRIW